MKKVASLVGAGAMLFSLTGSAFAFFPFFSDDTTIKNFATVKNYVETKSSTGNNEVHGKYVFGGKILTGDALALTAVGNTVNSNALGCGCDGDLYLKNKAYVKNDVETKAFTGNNEIGGMKVFGGFISTGNAGAESIVENVVNTNMTGGDVE